jgi:hypothetical protein
MMPSFRNLSGLAAAALFAAAISVASQASAVVNANTPSATSLAVAAGSAVDDLNGVSAEGAPPAVALQVTGVGLAALIGFAVAGRAWRAMRHHSPLGETARRAEPFIASARRVLGDDLRRAA